jgi:hypothetical protein
MLSPPSELKGTNAAGIYHLGFAPQALRCRRLSGWKESRAQRFGGGICIENGISANVTNSSFSDNQAKGGDNATATGTDITGVGGAEGGAVYSTAGNAASFIGCTFDQNQAQGGNGNTGSGSVVLVGEGLGGAIDSGYGGGALAPNTLTVSNSILTQNEAQGGDNNTGTGSVAGLVGAGAGAGIANYAGGTATVSGSDLDHNRAGGGQYNTAGGTGAVLAGLGAGGGIFNYLGNYNSSIYGLLNASVLTVSGSTIVQNQAQGGYGGNGEGGGIYVDSSGSATIDQTIIALNLAIGGLGDCGGSDGDGIGGGLYVASGGSVSLKKSIVAGNFASTSNNDIYGTVTYL